MQVLQHLTLTEAEFCRQAAQAVRSGPVYPGRRERMLTIGALFLFRLPLRLSVPSELASLQPENTPDLRSVLANWDDDRNRLRELLLNRSDRETRRVAIHHPLIGAIDWRDGSRFLYVHMQHHRWQLRRLSHSGKHLTMHMPVGGKPNPE